MIICGGDGVDWRYNFVFVCNLVVFLLASFNTLAVSCESQAACCTTEHRYEVQLACGISPRQP